jgi:membrane protease YdiL (CAAX protease family)
MTKILSWFAILFAIPVLASFLPIGQFELNCVVVVVLFLLTYLFYRKEGKSLAALGITTKGKDLRFIPLGLLAGIVFFCMLLFFQKIYNGLSLSLNPNADYGLVVKGLMLALPGVLMEELIFRGYCFQKSIVKIGPVKGNLLFALFFIAWHWLAFNAWGNWGLMLSLCTTGFGHVFFAVALGRSQTLFFPIALHLGNNWASRNLFSLSMGQIVDPTKAHDSLFLSSAPAAQFSTIHIVGGYAITIVCFFISTGIILLWLKKRSAVKTM